jgi:GTP 3',8-cyclase
MTPLIDPFARAISYLRVSVTDRCDFRCTYCMSEHMTFLPKADLLSLEELDRLCSTFVRLGVQKLRITGGEPLVRKGILTFFEAMSRHLQTGALKELTLTTNGSQLAKFAQPLADLGVRRVNVSLDTLDPAKFTADHPLGPPAPGAGRDRGRQGRRAPRQDQRRRAERLQRGRAFPPPRLVRREDHDLTFIEVMPMGEDMTPCALTSTGP